MRVLKAALRGIPWRYVERHPSPLRHNSASGTLLWRYGGVTVACAFRHQFDGLTVDLPNGCRFSLEQNPSWADREFVDEALGAYNAAFLVDDRYDYFGLFVRDEEDAIRAGLIGSLYAGWLFINLLWVHGDLRRQGVGSALIDEAERRAIAFGCHSAHVDTFSFQGPDFYPRFGYKIFGTLDYPPDHKRIFFQKRLIAEEA